MMTNKSISKKIIERDLFCCEFESDFDLMKASLSNLDFWDNDEDEIWNDV
jgi:hypothetical protein